MSGNYRQNTLILIFLLLTLPVSARVWHVCLKCPESNVGTIGDALKAASPGDTILVYWEADFPYFLENLVIDKAVRIISNAAAGDLTDFDLYPVITAVRSPVVHITVPGVELIGFNIRYLTPPSRENSDDRVFNRQVGIRMDVPATIKNCSITGCGTGILMMGSHTRYPQSGRIEKCRIGLPADHAVKDRKATGNLFGIVFIGSRGTPENKSQPLLISECLIMRNRFYGVVYSPSHPVKMKENLIEVNGKRPFRVAADTPDKAGRFVWSDE